MKHRGRFLPTDPLAPVDLELADRALDSPATLVPPQLAVVLSLVLWAPVVAVRGDHVHSDRHHPGTVFVEIAGLVAASPPGEGDLHHEVEQRLDQGVALVRTHAARVHGDRQADCIQHDHNLHALSGLGAADSMASAFRRGERAVHKALLEFGAVTLLGHQTESSEMLLETNHFHQTLAGPVNRTLPTELRGGVLPLRSSRESRRCGRWLCGDPLSGCHPSAWEGHRGGDRRAYPTDPQRVPTPFTPKQSPFHLR